MGLNNTQKVVLAIVVFIILLIGWGLFPLFFKWLMIGIGSTKKDIDDFGSMGDIYGSLNTLFTSATLLIVIYSAYLQRQANKDARTAMADQLQQARDATATQLTQASDALTQQLDQAREATAQQIENAKELSKIELSQTREATAQQLALAQATHDAQIKESKYSIFSNMFYALLTQKQASFNNLKLVDEDGNVIVADKIFYKFSTKFFDLLKSDWSNLDSIDKKEVFNAFFSYVKELNNNQAYTDINSYLGYYSSLVELIRRAEIDENDKIFFRELLTMSISASEQVTLLWVSSCTNIYKNRLIGSGIFNLNLNDLSLPFVVKFFEKSCFSNSNVMNQWDSYVKKQNPA